jgi:hypothetical protein
MLTESKAVAVCVAVISGAARCIAALRTGATGVSGREVLSLGHRGGRWRETRGGKVDSQQRSVAILCKKVMVLQCSGLLGTLASHKWPNDVRQTRSWP